MKIDFERLKEIELKYSNSGISKYVLRKMIDTITGDVNKGSISYTLSIETLKDLNILIDDKPEIKPLNS